MVLSLKDRVRATRLRQEEKRLRKLSQRSQSRSGGGGASANDDEELARGFSGTASVDKRSELDESETLGNAKVRRFSFFIHSTDHQRAPFNTSQNSVPGNVDGCDDNDNYTSGPE